MQGSWSWLEGFGPKVLVSMLFRLECHVDQRHWVCAFPGVSLPTLLPTIAHVFASATDGYALTVSSRPQSSSYPERVKSFEALNLLSEQFPIRKCFRLTHSSSKQRLAQHTYPNPRHRQTHMDFPKSNKTAQTPPNSERSQSNEISSSNKQTKCKPSPLLAWASSSAKSCLLPKGTLWYRIKRRSRRRRGGGD